MARLPGCPDFLKLYAMPMACQCEYGRQSVRNSTRTSSVLTAPASQAGAASPTNNIDSSARRMVPAAVRRGTGSGEVARHTRVKDSWLRWCRKQQLGIGAAGNRGRPTPRRSRRRRARNVQGHTAGRIAEFAIRFRAFWARTLGRFRRAASLLYSMSVSLPPRRPSAAPAITQPAPLVRRCSAARAAARTAQPVARSGPDRRWPPPCRSPLLGARASHRPGIVAPPPPARASAQAAASAA